MNPVFYRILLFLAVAALVLNRGAIFALSPLQNAGSKILHSPASPAPATDTPRSLPESVLTAADGPALLAALRAEWQLDETYTLAGVEQPGDNYLALTLRGQAGAFLVLLHPAFGMKALACSSDQDSLAWEGVRVSPKNTSPDPAQNYAAFKAWKDTPPAKLSVGVWNSILLAHDIKTLQYELRRVTGLGELMFGAPETPVAGIEAVAGNYLAITMADQTLVVLHPLYGAYVHRPDSGLPASWHGVSFSRSSTPPTPAYITFAEWRTRAGFDFKTLPIPAAILDAPNGPALLTALRTTFGIEPTYKFLGVQAWNGCLVITLSKNSTAKTFPVVLHSGGTMTGAYCNADFNKPMWRGQFFSVSAGASDPQKAFDLFSNWKTSHTDTLAVQSAA